MPIAGPPTNLPVAYINNCHVREMCFWQEKSRILNKWVKTWGGRETTCALDINGRSGTHKADEKDDEKKKKGAGQFMTRARNNGMIMKRNTRRKETNFPGPVYLSPCVRGAFPG